jgi:hypothetical protein
MFRLYVRTLDADKGNQFGEYELLNDFPFCNDVLTILPTLLISISKENVNKLPIEEEQMLRNNTEMMRTNEEVLYVFLENLYWKKYKRVMVENVIFEKNAAKTKDTIIYSEYENTDPYRNFMMNNGCYVFSGSGLTFPERIESLKSPFEIKEEKKVLAFGTAIKDTNSIVKTAMARAQAKMSKEPIKSKGKLTK